MAELLLGPVLRYVDDDEATVWVETDAPCEVEVLGRRAPDVPRRRPPLRARARRPGLEPGATTPYEVALDGERRWPRAGRGVPAERASARPAAGAPLADRLRLLPRDASRTSRPTRLRKDEDDRGREVDALRALALRMRRRAARGLAARCCCCSATRSTPTRSRPATRDLIAHAPRPREPPGEEVADFEEYTRLYREAWGEPVDPLAALDRPQRR